MKWQLALRYLCGCGSVFRSHYPFISFGVSERLSNSRTSCSSFERLLDQPAGRPEPRIARPYPDPQRLVASPLFQLCADSPASRPGGSGTTDIVQGTDDMDCVNSYGMTIHQHVVERSTARNTNKPQN
jgi:hypothetical protein